jgi:hypothetical protein
MKQKITLIILGIVVLVILGLYLSYTKTTLIQPQDDQSAVPQNDDQTGSPSLSFAPPAALTTKYITAQEWPPSVSVTTDAYTCPLQSEEFSTTTEKTINNQKYCVTLESEGAAGSTYKTYTYDTMLAGNNVKTSFTLQYVQCGNYSGAEMAACKTEQASFDPDQVVDSIMQSAAPMGE